MNYKKLKNIGLLLLILFSINSCSDDDSNGQTQDLNNRINEATLEWISTFDEQGKKITYINDANESVELELDFVSDLNEVFYTDCQVNGVTKECELEVVVIKFPEESQFENRSMFISIALFAEDEIRIMPDNSGGIVISAARYNENTGAIRTENSDNFSVVFDPEFEYENELRKAILIETLSIENLANGGSIPPKRLILVKGIGIVEWDDYVGNTWRLNN